jgi:hypothetical protein
MAHCLYLPLDGRPCNARFPVELAQLAGVDVRTPDLHLLGNAKTPAALKALDRWLSAACEASPADTDIALLISLETWLYGNLVASRKSTQSLAEVLQRLQALEVLKRHYPRLKIYTMGTLLRLSNSNDDTEERPYWKTHGMQIYRYSWLDHYLSSHSSREDDPYAQEFEDLRATIPKAILADYKALRQRNFAVLEAVTKGLQSGWIELCLLGCDDGGTYGWNVQEREALLKQQQGLGLEKQWLIYPGADELGSVLMARSLLPEVQTLNLQWTHPEAQHQVTRYEGIPLMKTLQAQAHATGIQLQESPSQAKGMLWIHNPPLAENPDDPHNQIDQFLDRDTRVSLADSSYERLSRALQAAPTDLPIMVADVLYANGGDATLLAHLEDTQTLFELSGYAAWNTTGNTLGYLLAWFKFYLHGLQNTNLPTLNQTQDHHRKLLMERLADDGLYQGVWRQQWCAHYTDPVTLDTCVQGIYAFNQRFRQWQETYPAIAAGGAPQVKQLSFPWRRFFEVDLQVCWPEVCTPQ